MNLQDTFYILGIIVMSISLITLIVMTAAVIVIRNKIIHIQQSIEEKLSMASAAADVAKKLVQRK